VQNAAEAIQQAIENKNINQPKWKYHAAKCTEHKENQLLLKR
jgi:hypothetical protein